MGLMGEINLQREPRQRCIAQSTSPIDKPSCHRGLEVQLGPPQLGQLGQHWRQAQVVVVAAVAAAESVLVQTSCWFDEGTRGGPINACSRISLGWSWKWGIGKVGGRIRRVLQTDDGSIVVGRCSRIEATKESKIGEWEISKTQKLATREVGDRRCTCILGKSGKTLALSKTNLAAWRRSVDSTDSMVVTGGPRAGAHAINRPEWAE